MKKVIENIEKIATIPGAVVDRNFLQGNATVRQQLDLRNGQYSEQSVQAIISDSKMSIAEMKKETHPFNIPQDYTFFLEYCGGLSIKDKDYYFSTYGTGPLVEEYYASIDSDMAMPDFSWARGLLKVGDLSIRRKNPEYHESYGFFLDIDSNVQENCVFRVGPYGLNTPSLTEIIEDLQHNPDKWEIIAESFTEFLELAAKTKGTFGYLN